MSALTVFFDMGGTLVDFPDIFEIITRRLVGRWPDKQTYDLVFKIYHGMVNEITYEEGRHPFRSGIDLHAATLALLVEKHGYRNISYQARDINVDTYGRKSVLFPETIPVLEKLLRHGARMIIASDNESEIFAVQLAKHDLGKYFVGSCISESVRAYKPSHGFVNHLKKYITGKAEDCYFVGDSPVDVESGQRLGIKSVLIDRRNTGIDADADYVIRDLNGLIPLMRLE